LKRIIDIFLPGEIFLHYSGSQIYSNKRLKKNLNIKYFRVGARFDRERTY